MTTFFTKKRDADVFLQRCHSCCQNFRLRISVSNLKFYMLLNLGQIDNHYSLKMKLVVSTDNYLLIAHITK